jgi:hypothetical protein
MNTAQTKEHFSNNDPLIQIGPHTNVTIGDHKFSFKMDEDIGKLAEYIIQNVEQMYLTDNFEKKRNIVINVIDWGKSETECLEVLLAGNSIENINFHLISQNSA